MAKKSDIRTLVDDSLDGGWHMYKVAKEGGLFTKTTYDKRIVHTRDELCELIKRGFDLEDSSGLLALNILLKIK